MEVHTVLEVCMAAIVPMGATAIPIKQATGPLHLIIIASLRHREPAVEEAEGLCV